MKALSEKLAAGLAAVPLTAADAPAAVSLSAEAGWTQIAGDWRLMIDLGEAIGVRDANGALVASALALPFDGPFAWIRMVLVTAAYRRRGIATALRTVSRWSYVHSRGRETVGATHASPLSGSSDAPDHIISLRYRHSGLRYPSGTAA